MPICAFLGLVPPIPWEVWERILGLVPVFSTGDGFSDGNAAALLCAHRVCTYWRGACGRVVSTLRYLLLQGCRDADQALGFFANQHCPRLRCIYAHGSGITVRGLGIIRQHWGGTLHYLDCCACRSLPEEAIDRLREETDISVRNREFGLCGPM